VQEFKKDVELVIKNATTYNGPDTVYFKAAEKLLVQAEKIMSTEVAEIIPDPVVTSIFEPAMEDESSQDSIIMKKDVLPKEFYNPPERKSYKTKHWEELEGKLYSKFHPDGTRFYGFLYLCR
jgi:hypothetical protein